MDRLVAIGKLNVVEKLVAACWENVHGSMLAFFFVGVSIFRIGLRDEFWTFDSCLWRNKFKTYFQFRKFVSIRFDIKVFFSCSIYF